MRQVIVLWLLGLAACAAPPETAPNVASRGPGPSYHCIAPRLPALGLRQHTQPTTDGWRMRVEILAGPPGGWYDKGQIEYSSGRLAYIPNGATLGIADARMTDIVRPLLQACSG